MATYCVVKDGDPNYSDDRFKTREEAECRLNEVEALGHRATLVRWENDQPAIIPVEPAIKTAAPIVTVFIARLLRRGFRWTHATRKVVELTHEQSGEIVYLMLENTTGTSLLRVRPERLDLGNAVIEGVKCEGPKHSSNMRKFPQHMNEGAKPMHYGLAFTIDSTTALDHFIDRLLKP